MKECKKLENVKEITCDIVNVERIENTQKMCGHCLRAYWYFKDQMQDIDPNNPESINSIKEKYPTLRDESKTISFRFQYMGGWRGLIKSHGFSAEQAENIYKNNLELYSEAASWNKQLIQDVSEKGYATLAFGLKLRAHNLTKTVINSRNVPQIVAGNIRSVVNAASGQSYCMLTERAGVDMRNRIAKLKLEQYIRPSIHVHDSLMFIVKNNASLVKWLNDNLVDAISYQDLEEIKHEELFLEGECTICPNGWHDEIPLENNASINEIEYLLERINEI